MPGSPTAQEQRMYSMYAEVPPNTREDLLHACIWARGKLAQHRPIFNVAAGVTGVYCSIAFPEIAHTFTGPDMDSGSEAMVMAVCRFLVQA